MIIEIAGVKIGLEFPEELIHENFRLFRSDGNAEIRVRTGSESDLSISAEDQCVSLLDYDVHYSGDCIVCLTAAESSWAGFAVCFTSSEVICVPKPDRDWKQDPLDVMALMRGGIYALLQQRGIYILHSASVVYKGKVYAFSAPSGTGKSTHADLWVKAFGVPYFNGDLLALRAGEVPATAYGTPWCGSSGHLSVDPLPLGGVFFLRRGKENSVRPVEGFEKLMLLCQRLIALNFVPGSMAKIMREMEPTAGSLPCAVLTVNMDISAAETAKAYVDSI